ncbi:MAG: hypothetical protein ACI9S8_000479 [Chlamydiales bacterium]|jgi:hypothetical protein
MKRPKNMSSICLASFGFQSTSLRGDLPNERFVEISEAVNTANHVYSYVEQSVRLQTHMVEDSKKRLLLELQEQVDVLVQRVFEKLDLERVCYSLALCYFDRFIGSIAEDINPTHIPYYYVGSLCLAQKYLDDDHYINRDFSLLTGVSIKDFNRLELSILKTLEFKLEASMSDISQYFSPYELRA